MAGSFNHLVGADGRFKMDPIENPGDAREALEECYAIIYNLAGGDTLKVSSTCAGLGFPDPWNDEYGDDHKEAMKL